MKLHELKICFPYQYMTIRQLAILILLSSRPLMVRQISNMLGIPTPAVTRAFDGLANMKFLKRSRGTEDARDCFGELTEKGIEFVDKLHG